MLCPYLTAKFFHIYFTIHPLVATVRLRLVTRMTDSGLAPPLLEDRHWHAQTVRRLSARQEDGFTQSLS